MRKYRNQLNNRFPDNFVWGVATSSYQIEGAYKSDGKGPSIWDTFTHLDGKIKNNHTGDIACDHYHKWKEDVALLKKLGVDAYRFSISWPRILPLGNGCNINEKGMSFYDRLVDELISANITPFVTLFHWDLPQHIQDLGGWTNRSTVDCFVNYVDQVTRRLGDRVKHWITHNEPWVVSMNGHLHGHHAPGGTNWCDALAASHHLLLSHGQSVSVIRRNSLNSQVGITLNLCPSYPASSSEHDMNASIQFDGEFNRWVLDPVYRASYPQEVIDTHLLKNRIVEVYLSFIQNNDLKWISEPIDFLGVNFYSRAIIRNGEVPEQENGPIEIRPGEVTDNGWEIYPEGLYDLMIRLQSDYKIDSIYITENGAAYSNDLNGSGEIKDWKRIEYIRNHLFICLKILKDNNSLKGYFLWTLMDNFEWADGYTQKFGLVHIEPETLERIPKDSFHWFRQVILENSPSGQ